MWQSWSPYPKKQRYPLTVWMALFLLAPAGRAEPPKEPAKGNPTEWVLKREPSPAWAPLPEKPQDASKVPPEWLEEHGAVYLHNSTRLLLSPDGTTTTSSTQIIRLLGRKAIAALGDHRDIVFDPSFEKCALHHAFVVGTDGKRRELESRHCQLRDVVTDFAVYQNDKQAILSFPGLQVGDTVVVQWTTVGKNPEYKGHSFGRFTLGMVGFPTLEEVISLGVPAGRKFRARLKGLALEPSRNTRDSIDWIEWKAIQLSPLELEDAQSADTRDMEPEISFSTFVSWDEVGKWQANLRPDLWTVTPSIAALIDKILGPDGKNLPPSTKATRLAHWVKRNIRYLSVGVGHHFTPHSPGDVLSNRHGDCKDTAQLLVLMMIHAGLKAELASLGVKGDGQVDEEIPSPWATHALVRVTLPGTDGSGPQNKWIDTTEDLSGWDQLNEMDSDRLCYLVGPQGTCRLERTPAAQPKDCQWVILNRLKVRADGSASLNRIVTATGEAAVGYRDAFLEEPPVRRKRYLEEQLQDLASQVTVKGLKVDPANLDLFDAPLRFEIDLELKGLFNPPEDPGDAVALPLTEHIAWDTWFGKKVRFPAGDKPLKQGQPLQVDSTWVVETDKGVTIQDLPEDTKTITPWGSLSRSAQRLPADQKLVLRFRATRQPAEVRGPDREQYLQFLDSARDLWQAVLPVQVREARKP